jgi:hypothetical protein
LGLFVFKEGVMSDKLQNDIGFLATKVRIIGEYLVIMEKDEMTGSNHNEYHNIGETLYCTGQRILELSEEK